MVRSKSSAAPRSAERGAFVPPGELWQTLADVRTEALDWLFPQRIPRSMLSLIEAKKNGGKSTMLSAIAAHVLGGPPLPGRRREPKPAQVLWLAGEESAAQAVRPRIEEAGGDPRGVILPGMDEERGIRRRLYLPGDLGRLDALVSRCNVRLIVADPYISFVPASSCMRDEDGARAVLEPLAEWASSRGVTVLYSRHLSKGRHADPLDAGLGSTAVGAVARAIVRLDPHPTIPGLRTMCRVACCARGTPPNLLYRIVGDRVDFGRIQWEGETDLSIAEVIDAATDAVEQSALDDAMMIVRGILSDAPKPSKQLLDEALGAGVSVATLRRARIRLGCLTRRVTTGQTAYVEWRLPDAPAAPKKDNKRRKKG
jgi:hypothetical protein